MGDEEDEGAGGTQLAKNRRELEAELRELNAQVAALGRSLAEERGRSLAVGGALRALEIAVGGAQARAGGACRALDRANERLRLQQEAGQLLWAELEAARAARAGAELRAQEAESAVRSKGEELRRLRQAVAEAQLCRRRAEQERDQAAAQAPRPPPSTTLQAVQDPRGLQVALAALREHNRELQQRLERRRGQAEDLRRELAEARERAQEAAGARARLEQEQRALREQLERPRVPSVPTEAALRARCCHLQELLHREADARAALGRASRAAGRRLRALWAELEEQRLRGESYRRQADASAASGRALLQALGAVAAGTSRAEAQGRSLRRALEAVGSSTSEAACAVAVLRTRLRCDPLTLSRTVRRMLRGEDSAESQDSDGESAPCGLQLLLHTHPAP